MNRLVTRLITGELSRLGFKITAVLENYRGMEALTSWDIVQPGIKAILWETQNHGLALRGSWIAANRKEYSINLNGAWPQIKARLQKAVKEAT